MRKLSNLLYNKLEERKSKGLFRSLYHSQAAVDFTSNDYLGLARSEELKASIDLRLKEIALPYNGSTGSRLLSGNTTYIEGVEAELARIFRASSALLFNSGYAANLAVLSSLPQKNDTIIYDELAHASLKDGARLSLARRYSFRHNDLTDLENKIKRSTGHIFVALESIYSMNGDESPLIEVVKLCRQYDTILILDEAHSTGVVGAEGSGLCVSQGLEDEIDVRIYTFGKGMGVHGACVVGSKVLTEYLTNFSRPFIYTTALSPHTITSIECAFKFLAKHIDLQSKLIDNIKLFLSQTATLSSRIVSNSAIQTFIVSGNRSCREAAFYLQSKDFDVRPILSPTVSNGYERLRICLHTYNSEAEIISLAKALKELFNGSTQATFEQ